MRCGLFVVLLAVLASPFARAEDATDADSEAALAARSPAPYWIHGSLHGVVATLGIRYHLDAIGPTARSTFDVAVPQHAVVTSAVAVVDGERHLLTLDPATHATETFDQLAVTPAGAHRRWAIAISTGYASAITASVAAPRSATITLDLEVEVPTCFRDDVRLVAIPAAWRSSVDHQLAVMGRAAKDPCSGRVLDVEEDGELAWIAFPTREAASQPAGEARITSHAGRLDVPHGHFARVELALARQLTEVAPDLHTVFVIDGSRSVTGHELDVQAKLIESYARHAPHTQIQIIAYARKAHTLLPAWTSTSQLPQIHRALAVLEVANGSNVDVGLVAASAWLAQIHGTRRIVLLTDQRVADRLRALEPKVLKSVLPAATLVHVVALGETPASNLAFTVQRNDTVEFGRLAQLTEGLAADAQLDQTGELDATKLVRPIALEHFTLKTAGWSDHANTPSAVAQECTTTDELAEGSSCTWWGSGDGHALTFEGLMWNHPVTRTIVPTTDTLALARMLSTLDDLGAAKLEILEAAHAVNAAWSMVAVWGGADGYGDIVDGAFGFGATCGCGGSSDLGTSGFGSSGTLGSQDSLETQLSRAVRGCHVASRVEVALELTVNEIVDVAVTTDDATVRDCVTEAVWSTPILLAHPRPHATARVVL